MNGQIEYLLTECVRQRKKKMCIRDRYYYSESLQTVWVYIRRAAGRITAVSPSASAPTALTVAGSTYSPVSYTHLDVYKRQG